MFVKQSPATKVWRVKQVKQVWKATGKLFTTIGHQWRPTGRLLPLGDQWPITRNTPPKVLPTKHEAHCRLPPVRNMPLVRSTALTSDCMQLPQETKCPCIDMDREAYEIGRLVRQKAGLEHKIDFIESQALPALDKLLENVSSRTICC
ncbi:retrovirus-related pol polyprotein from transposon TNT 1-94 [Tanacetum coccineum]|uniref:Retrovirus-related pol polyprotein from transposon TNT 1-94 n=1 Tax=Tanacetum coccineum TaxID=301880 RepID=A0ABQ5IPW9_9ASTR